MIDKFLQYIEKFNLENEYEQLRLPHLDHYKKNKTRIKILNLKGIKVKQYINEFWTSKQRQANSIHEISYRACFKPQLPNFFIRHLTHKGDYVYDPFAGRGTTLIEAALMERKFIGNDINPLSRILAEPRLLIPNGKELEEYLYKIPDKKIKNDIDLSMFYHPQTEVEILSIRDHILTKEHLGTLNKLDKWIRMVATNRLTGHSKGFFSVYSLPPNQAVTPEKQIQINKKRGQKPEYRNVRELILKKTMSLLRDITNRDKKILYKIYQDSLFLTKDARDTKEIPDNFIQLTVTSPPFLNIVHYAQDNWLRCWFNGIDVNEIEKKISTPKKLEDWSKIMLEVFHELYRVTKRKGFVAFEVGEIQKGQIKLEEEVVLLAKEVGFDIICVLINQQKFTKTSNIWGIKNNKKGTNTNRIVLLQKK